MAETAKKTVKKSAKKAPTKAAKKAGAKTAAKTAPKKAAVKKTAVKKAAPGSTDAMRSKAAGVIESAFFKTAVDRAKTIAADPQKLRDVADKAGRSAALRTTAFASVIDEIQALIRLVVAYARGNYRQIPLDKFVMVVAGLVYIVTPIDLIPDALVGVGFLDDAVVVGWVVKRVREELDAFRAWEAGQID